MLETITPIRFHAPLTSGRTKPARLECEKEDASLVEVVGKFAGGCERGVTALAIEVIAACLAADLGLPIPKPFLLSIDPDWVLTIPDPAYRNLVARSGTLAFGSTEVGPDYRAWSASDRLSMQMLPVAAAIFCFDAFVNNMDRRDGNPNCLVRSHQLRIFDHELTFVYKGVLFWREPWKIGSLAAMASNGAHIFHTKLKGKDIDLTPIRTAWAALSDADLARYKGAVPAVWSDAESAVADAISLIQGVRDHIDDALAEVRRVLT